jgi:hypothetical protein
MSKKLFTSVPILALLICDSLVRPWTLDWGASPEERKMGLPGDERCEHEPQSHPGHHGRRPGRGDLAVAGPRWGPPSRLPQLRLGRALPVRRRSPPGRRRAFGDARPSRAAGSTGRGRVQPAPVALQPRSVLLAVLARPSLTPVNADHLSKWTIKVHKLLAGNAKGL